VGGGGKSLQRRRGRKKDRCNFKKIKQKRIAASGGRKLDYASSSSGNQGRTHGGEENAAGNNLNRPHLRKTAKGGQLLPGKTGSL